MICKLISVAHFPAKEEKNTKIYSHQNISNKSIETFIILFVWSENNDKKLLAEQDS